MTKNMLGNTETNKLFDAKIVNHQGVIERLVKDASPRKTFLALIFLSSVVAALGLLNNSSSVVIGAMLIAPLLWPVLGVGMSFIVRDIRMFKLSILSIIVSCLIAIFTAMGITFFYVPLGASHEILLLQNISFMIPVAIASGVAAAFSLVYDHIREAVTGVAISVALLPPLVSIGIGLGGADWDLMSRAARLFGLNLVSIIGTSFIVFALLGFFKYRKTAEAAVLKEEKVLTK